LFTAIFEMPDNSEFSVVYSDSLLQGEGCSFSVLQTAIAINACGDSTSIARTVSFVDTEQPTFIDCLPTATVICNTYGNNLQAPAAIDNCSTDVIVTYTEECMDCAADSLIYPLSTPVLPIDNPCNYPYDWSMGLMTAPFVHRYFKIESYTPAVMIDYLNGSIHFSGRFINAMDSTGGFDFNVTLGEGQNWETWSGDPNNNGYFADCGSIDDNHEEWMYYILQSQMGAELIGWGSYAGSELNLYHAPVSGYFGIQMGLGANNYNEQFGVGGWSTYIGTILYNAESVQPTGNSGSCNLRFAAPSCSEHTSEITWTATDCAGNSASCIQTVHFIPEIDEPECLVNTPCNDNDSCTINDTFQADCTCAGFYADADGDGLCDAEDNCDNTLAGTVCDDGDACTVNDVIQADCICAGTYTDTDSDGVCDASEIAGCMDMEACNYSIDATDEDGSCTYVESLAIDGSVQATAGETVNYTYPGPALSTYAWSANPGAITTGQGTTQVSVVWESALSGIISVVETNNENCGGDTVMLAVSIEPSAVTAWSQEHLVVYPNPASDQINLIGNIPPGTPLFLYNSIGACVMTTPFASTIDVGHLPAGLYHVRIALANVRLEESLVILR
jgi:hypothetical protein